MGAPDAGSIRVEVVYALPDEQALVVLSVPGGTSAGEAVDRSGLVERYGISAAKIGIFGRVVDASTRLRDGDRVEIYRPLIADPKTGRRERASRRR